MESIIIDARAKINWSLAVTGKRENGYHELDMLMQSISLSDRIEISKADDFSLTINGKKAGKPINNLCYKASQAFYAYTGIKPACAIKLKKSIPIGAGMGGGSSDAAAVLIGLNMLHRTGIPRSTLTEIGYTLGADIPFMFSGGLQRARGIGEILSRCKTGGQFHFVGLMPSSGAATRDIFSKFDINADLAEYNNDMLANALAQNDIIQAAKYMVNHLQHITEGMNRQVSDCIALLKKSGAIGAVMTGSGTACYGVFADKADADTAYGKLLNTVTYKAYRFSSRSSSMDIVSVK